MISVGFFCVLRIFSRWIIVFESSMPFSWICSIIIIPLIFVNLQCRAEFGMLRLCVWFLQLCLSVQIPIINHNGTIIMMNFSLWILVIFKCRKCSVPLFANAFDYKMRHWIQWNCSKMLLPHSQNNIFSLFILFENIDWIYGAKNLWEKKTQKKQLVALLIDRMLNKVSYGGLTKTYQTK